LRRKSANRIADIEAREADEELLKEEERHERSKKQADKVAKQKREGTYMTKAQRQRQTCRTTPGGYASFRNAIHRRRYIVSPSNKAFTDNKKEQRSKHERGR
jgi:hypothetical protein